jgi:hypothetical protein
MPSGGNTPLNDEDWQVIDEHFRDAKKQGLEREWLQYFIGGLVHDKLPVRQASYNACIEWDF